MEYLIYPLSPAPQIAFSHTHTTDHLNTVISADRGLVEITLMETGRILQQVDGLEDLAAQEGDVTVLPPDRSSHTFTLPDSALHSHTTVAARFSDGLRCTALQEVLEEKSRADRSGGILHTAVIPRHLAAPFVTPLAKGLFKSLARENMTRDYGYASLLSSLFTALSVELTRACFQSMDALHATPSNLLLISNLKEYLAQHFSQELSLDQLAERMGINKEYMCNLFKRFTGSTIITYRNLLRIQHFKSLARMGGLKINEMAHLSGFNDEFYFSKTFKKLEGVSPSQYLALLKTYRV